jgi:hypothetical protein
MAVHKYLDASTAHVSKATADWLAGQARDTLKHGVIPTLVVYDYLYGWFVPVPEDMDRAVPFDLRAVLNHAKQHGCILVRLDGDGDEIEGLPTFKW